MNDYPNTQAKFFQIPGCLGNVFHRNIADQIMGYFKNEKT